MRFDIDDYKQRTGRLDLDGIDFKVFTADPLQPDALRCLRYMHDVEYHTVCYLRELLLTSAHDDPDVTAFLSFWAFEELWHGEAIAAVLRAHNEVAGETRVARLRQGMSRRERLKPLTHLALSALAGADYTAVHMTWGAVNELCTQAAYGRLISLTDHRALRELLTRIMRQEGRHVDFYASEAARRLAASAKARRLTRTALTRLWRPVGAGVMPVAETRFISGYLFGGADGLAVARRIDRHVQRLPGLAGLSIVEDAATATEVAATTVPAGAARWRNVAAPGRDGQRTGSRSRATKASSSASGSGRAKW